MIAGSIIVFGKLGIRAGAGMLRGSSLLHPLNCSTYRYDCTYQPGFLKVMLCSLQGQGLAIPQDHVTAASGATAGI